MYSIMGTLIGVHKRSEIIMWKAFSFLFGRHRRRFLEMIVSAGIISILPLPRDTRHFLDDDDVCLLVQR